MVFELTDAALTLTTIAPAGDRATRTWPRAGIADVSVAPQTGRLVIRLRDGRQSVEFFIGSPEIALAVARGLHHALAALPPPTTPMPAAPNDDVIAGLDALPTRPLRKLVWWVFGLLVTIAALFLLTGHACGAAYVLMLAAAPAALAIGMGERDVYL